MVGGIRAQVEERRRRRGVVLDQSLDVAKDWREYVCGVQDRVVSERNGWQDLVEEIEVLWCVVD